MYKLHHNYLRGLTKRISRTTLNFTATEFPISPLVQRKLNYAFMLFKYISGAIKREGVDGNFQHVNGKRRGNSSELSHTFGIV
jgi:hypothetical protein